jgi:hypothetical protein
VQFSKAGIAKDLKEKKKKTKKKKENRKIKKG